MLPSENANERRIPTLDGLRGLAVLLVLLQHFVYLNPAFNAPLGSFRSYVRASLGLTYTGVDLFFVLSGFLIGGILIHHRDSPAMMKTFYVRRALRILPLAWLSIVVLLFLYSGHAAQPAAPWWVYAGFLTNIHQAMENSWGFGPLVPHWSLAIEEQFYLLFPFLVRAWPKTKLLWLGPTLIGVAILSRLTMWVVWPDRLFACHVLTVCRLDALCVGFTCACLVRDARWMEWAQRHRSRLWISLGCLSVGILLLLKLHAGPGDAALATWGYTNIALFYANLLLLVNQPAEAWLSRIFAHPLLTIFGLYSFFIYLFQGSLGTGLTTLLFRWRWEPEAGLTWLECLALPVILCACAALSWRCFERPLIRLGRRLSYR